MRRACQVGNSRRELASGTREVLCFPAWDPVISTVQVHKEETCVHRSDRELQLE